MNEADQDLAPDADPTAEAADEPAPTVPTTMRAAVRETYGDSDVLEVAEVAVPSPAPGQVLVAVEAAALNPLDWHLMTGVPWIARQQSGVRRPRESGIGTDFAGRVVAVGDAVTTLAPGDEVVGSTSGACAELVVATADRLVAKPGNVGFAEAAGTPIAAMTALQALRDKGELEAGQRVLVNGASGGVGIAAVQLARWMGAEVTAVCSTRNVELVRSLGADHVIDYTHTDFTDTDARFDVFLDNQGNRSIGASRRLLTHTGVYVLVGGPKSNKVLGPVGRMLRTLLRFSVAPQRARPFITSMRRDDLVQVVELLSSGALRTVIDATYPLEQVRAAMDHLASGHARGKVVVEP